MKDQSQWN